MQQPRNQNDIECGIVLDWKCLADVAGDEPAFAAIAVYREFDVPWIEVDPCVIISGR